MELYWYALQTKPRKERQVQEYLSTRKIESYLPCEQTMLGKHSNVRPYFPAYLFVHVNMKEVGLWSLYYAPGVRRVVMAGDEPIPVADIIIARMRERLEKIDTFDNRGNPVKPGDSVKITLDPYSELEAVFDRKLSPSGRVRLLVDFLGRWARMELDSDQIQRTGKSARPDLLTS